MIKIRPSAVAGKFYTANPDELKSQIIKFDKEKITDYDCKSRAIIVPHAGYLYSGQLACEGFQYLDKNAKNIFVIAPAHYALVKGAAVSSANSWETPLGNLQVNEDISRELTERFKCEYNDEALAPEHSVEVQLPFILYFAPKAKIIPILVGDDTCGHIEEIISHYWQNPDNSFVISSDLSHFYSSDYAKKIDILTAKMVESAEIEEFNPHQACGSVGICALSMFAKRNNFSLIRVNLKNSGEVTGDDNRVVGYGSWFLYEGQPNRFIKDNFSKLTIDICKKTILRGVEDRHLPTGRDFIHIPQIFEEEGACFVTLEKNGNLRGCIGSITAHRSLFDDLVRNSYNSAFSDTRFKPVSKDELEDISISVSLLSVPSKMIFKNEEDLLAQIRPYIDGIIIKDGAYQAVYLPSVWEQLPEKSVFLNSLKQKAGLPSNYFSKTFEAYKFTTEYIEV